MKKKILTVAILLAALCGMPAIAQNPNKGQARCAQKEQCDSTAGCNRKGDRGPRKCAGNPFEEVFAGLNLTADQQTALNNIKPACPKGSCQNNDSTAGRPDPKQMRRDYLNQVKQVLTPDQYVIFLENVVVEQGPKGPRKEMRQGNRQDRQQMGNERNHARKGNKNGNCTKNKGAKGCNAANNNTATANK